MVCVCVHACMSVCVCVCVCAHMPDSQAEVEESLVLPSLWLVPAQNLSLSYLGQVLRRQGKISPHLQQTSGI